MAFINTDNMFNSQTNVTTTPKKILSPQEWLATQSASPKSTTLLPQPSQKKILSPKEWLAQKQSVSNMPILSSAIQDIENAAKQYVSGVKNANQQLNQLSVGKNPAGVGLAGRVHPSQQQVEATQNLYNTAIATPAGYIAETPGVPVPIREVAGALYTPELINNIEQAATTPVNGKSTNTGLVATAENAAKNIGNQFIVQPLENAVNELENPSDILRHPTKLWTNVLPGTMLVEAPTRGGIEGYNRFLKKQAYGETAPENPYETKHPADTIGQMKNEQENLITDPVTGVIREKTPDEKAAEQNQQTNQAAKPLTPVVPVSTQQKQAKVKEPARVVPPAIGSLAEQAKAANPTFNGKPAYEQTNDEFDRARAAEIGYTAKISMPKKTTGVEGRELPGTKTIMRERGLDSKDDFTHEIRHALFDNVLKGKGQDVYNSERAAAQKYLYKYRRHDFTHPDNRSSDPVKQWQENSQAFIDEYFKRPDLLKANLPKIYNFLDNSALKDYAKFDVSHKELVEQALADGKTVPQNVLAEYRDLAKQQRGLDQAEQDKIIGGTANTGGNVTKGVGESERPSSFAETGQTLVAPERPMSEQLAKQLFGNQQLKFQAMDNLYKTTKKSLRDIKQLIAPASVSAEAGLTGRSMRENLSDMARKYDIAEDAMHTAKQYFDNVPESESRQFIDAVEKGNIASLAPELQPFAKVMSDALSDRVKQVQALGTGKLQNLVDNYFPHIWKDPKQAEIDFGRWFGKRPLSGSEAFTKQRTIPTTADGLKWRVYDKDDNMLGSFDNQTDAEALAAKTPDSRIGQPLQPVSSNPVDLTLLKLREMDKYIMAHKTLNELKGEGLAKLVRVDQDHPLGWIKIDDKISTVYNKAGKFNYWVQPDAAELINNYLSPGIRGSKLGSTYELTRNASNWLNQFQLGMSAFHLGFTSYDTIVSKLALAMKQATSGQYGGALKSTGEALSLSAPFTTFVKGNKYLSEWYKPGSQGEEIGKIMDSLSSGGARARMDKFYATKGQNLLSQEFKDIWTNATHGNIRTAAGHTLKQLIPYNFVRIIPRLIMEDIVPRQKLGVAASMMEYEMKKNPNMTHDQMREVASKVWNSTDNRLGQLVYDNLFWNKTLKDGLMLSTRSVGWNLGTWRELGGGVVDLAKMPVDLYRGKPMEFSHRTSYVAGLTLATALSGSVIQYLATGQPPQDWRDYFFPQVGGRDANGNPERVSLPSYAKDIYTLGRNIYRHGLAHGIVETGTNKINPFFQELYEMYQNKDYSGKQIVNPHDTYFQRAGEEGKFIASGMEPFSVQGLNKMHEAQEPLYKQILPFVGVMPAPSDINKTEAQLLASDINQQRFGEGRPKTEVEAETQTLEGRIKRDLQQGNTTSLVDALRNGKISKDQFNHLREFRGMTPLQQQVHGMALDDAVDVYNAANADEKAQLKPILLKEINNKIRKGTPDERTAAHALRQQLFGQ